MTSEEIKAGLADRALEVARYLYPNGKRRGREWLVGNAEAIRRLVRDLC